MYDFSKPVVLKGTITKFEWLNPHNQIYFDVTDEKGTVSHWIAATEPPQVMLERGWTRRSLKEGDEVTVYIFAAKNGAKVGNLQKIVLADGKELTAAGRRRSRRPGEIDARGVFHAKSADAPGDSVSRRPHVHADGARAGARARRHRPRVSATRSPRISPVTGRPDGRRGGIGQSLSVSDIRGEKRGKEDDIPYLPWAREKTMSERTSTGPDPQFGNTTDPQVLYCEPPGVPHIYLWPIKHRSSFRRRRRLHPPRARSVLSRRLD